MDDKLIIIPIPEGPGAYTSCGDHVFVFLPPGESVPAHLLEE